MVMGLLSSLRTILWGMILFGVMIYTASVLLTQTIGALPDGEQEVIKFRRELFSTVPRSMFTVFRCLMGDCASLGGTPLAAELSEAYGFRFVGLYILFSVIIVFGLFNLLSAVIVESTLVTAKTNESQMAAVRRDESRRIAKKLHLLVQKLLVAESKGRGSTHTDDLEATTSNHRARGLFSFIYSAFGFSRPRIEEDVVPDLNCEEVSISNNVFQIMLSDPEIKRLLDDMDVAENERCNLFDVIDADGSGEVSIEELVTGLLKVRGDVRKSDVVACRLSLRSAQEQLKSLGSLMLRRLHETHDMVQNTERRTQAMLQETQAKVQNLENRLVEFESKAVGSDVAERLGRLEASVNALVLALKEGGLAATPSPAPVDRFAPAKLCRRHSEGSQRLLSDVAT